MLKMQVRILKQGEGRSIDLGVDEQMLKMQARILKQGEGGSVDLGDELLVLPIP